MKLEYTGPHDEVEIGDSGVTCKRGAVVDVPDELGKPLLDQPSNWQPVKAAPKAKEARDGSA